MAKPMAPLAAPCKVSLANCSNEDLTGVGGSSWEVDKIAADYFGRKPKIILVIVTIPVEI